MRPVHSFEALPTPRIHELVAPDGWRLHVRDFSPSCPSTPPVGVVVLGHAMMVDGRSLCRSGRASMASVLVASGFRVLCPDLRGHGRSGPLAAEGGDWDVDELVTDVGVYVALARRLEPALPLALIGHSLFGQLALAWLGSEPGAGVDAVVAMACDVWNRRFEPRRLVWWFKRAFAWPAMLLVALLGYLPVRRLRLGSADEARSYWRQFNRWLRTDSWRSVSGEVDYWANLERMRVPLLHLLSEGDLLYGRPASASRMSAPAVERELLVLGRDDAPGELSRLRPSHMKMLTDPRNKLAWHWVAGWLQRTLGVDAEGGAARGHGLP